MKCSSIISLPCFVAGLGLLAMSLVGLQQTPRAMAAADKPAAGPSHQVIACYFHRTVRCPTCRKISAYIEESVNTGFASQVKDGSVKMLMIDFQDPKNQKYTEAYRITGPTLVLMDVHDGKVTSWNPAPKVWSLVGNKDEFFRYVQGEMRGYLEVKRTAAR
jgi:hypothetical protein